MCEILHFSGVNRLRILLSGSWLRSGTLWKGHLAQNNSIAAHPWPIPPATPNCTLPCTLSGYASLPVHAHLCTLHICLNIGITIRIRAIAFAIISMIEIGNMVSRLLPPVLNLDVFRMGLH